MEMNFFPECYFDTVLVKHILRVKRVNHQKTCDKVTLALNKIDDFAVGIIDRDKKVVKYLAECTLEIERKNLLLWKHKSKQHFIIQLAPALERWILQVIEEGNVDVEDLGIPMNLDKLKDFTKYQTVSEDQNMHRLCDRLINSSSYTITTLTLWLRYLLVHNRKADIEEMKKWV
jgi:hypothetical protein